MASPKYYVISLRHEKVCLDDGKENMKALRILNASLPKQSIKVYIVEWTVKYLLQTKKKSQISQVLKSHISNFFLIGLFRFVKEPPFVKPVKLQR